MSEVVRRIEADLKLVKRQQEETRLAREHEQTHREQQAKADRERANSFAVEERKKRTAAAAVASELVKQRSAGRAERRARDESDEEPAIFQPPLGKENEAIMLIGKTSSVQHGALLAFRSVTWRAY